MFQDVYIIGATGRVGSTLVRQIIEKGDISARLHTNPTRIVGLASRERTVYVPEGVSAEQAYAFTNKDYTDTQTYRDLLELLELVNSTRHDGGALVFVDVTAVGEQMTGFHLAVIERTPHGIVTANKNPLTLCDYSLFQQLSRYPRRYGYRCSVMAGAEAVPFLQDLRDLNDRLFTIEGCLSGTIGYITSELEKSKPFSMILQQAHASGYTEPHPRDDLSGLDVARKLCILARTAGYPINIEDIKLEPFVPREFLLENDVERFLQAANLLDEDFKGRMSRAQKHGKTLRYVARMNNRGNCPDLTVSLQEVPQDSSLGNLEGTKNKSVIASEAYMDGYSIESIGAGLQVTARNIRRDLLGLLPKRSF
ncbi:hypothetical protein HY772_02155 [Candidatus Woesearchaeota archaeon]|nr:hypothetical protein [Candidatus Woesearchaeota archaeon]